MAAAAGDGFNYDFWLGMVAAGPVLLVAFSARGLIYRAGFTHRDQFRSR